MRHCVTRCLWVLLSAIACLSTSAPAVALDLNWAQKLFPQQSYDFGTVARGATVVHKIPLKNIWEPAVQVSSVQTSCQCISARLISQNPNSMVIPSLETGEIELTVNTRQYSRQRNVNLTVTFSSPNFVQVVIPLQVYIRTDVVLEPGSVSFGAIAQGEGQERRVKIDYAGRADWAIGEVTSRNPNLTAAVKETFRDNAGRVQYELVVNATEKLEAGELREYVQLVTNDAGSPRVPVLIEGRVEAEFTVTPNPLIVGNLKPGDQKKINVVIRARKPFSIEKIESESGSQAFQINLPSKDKSNLVHVLPLTIVAPEQPGPLTEQFTLTVNGGHVKSVDFKLVGKVIGAAGTEGSAPMPVTTAKPPAPGR